MANNCPKVTSFEFKPLKKEFPNYFFTPIIENWGENLTFLSLPGEGIDDDNSGGDANDTLVSNVIDFCDDLEVNYLVKPLKNFTHFFLMIFSV